MNNWHIKIADCTEAQKERLKQVYGVEILRYGYYGRDENNIAAYNFDIGELLTPDEAFERLGLNHYAVNQKLSKQIVEAEQKIKELEQQLAAKPELQGIDWSKAPNGTTGIGQCGVTITWINNFCARFYNHKVFRWQNQDTPHLWEVIATRPKPKYTPEQIEAVKDFDAWVSRRHKLSGEFNWWLKEVGND